MPTKVHTTLTTYDVLLYCQVQAQDETDAVDVASLQIEDGNYDGSMVRLPGSTLIAAMVPMLTK